MFVELNKNDMAIYTCIMCGQKYGPLLADPFGLAKGIKTRDGNYACSDRCARDWNHHSLNSGGSANNSSNNSSNNPEREKSSGGGLMGMLGGVLNPSSEKSAAKTLGSIATVGAILAFNSIEEKKHDDKINSIKNMTISADKGELEHQLNELLTIGIGADDSKIKKACYEKMDYGIMKLRGMGANAEADFFDKKKDGIKPKKFGLF